MQLLIVYILLLLALIITGCYIFRKLRDMSANSQQKKSCHSCPLKDACHKECPDRKKTA